MRYSLFLALVISTTSLLGQSVVSEGNPIIIKEGTSYDPRGTIDTDEKLRMTGVTSDYIISLQDGTGRVQHYWNSSTNTSKYLISNEEAGKIQFSPASTNFFALYWAPKGTASNNISWKSYFMVTNAGKIGIGTSSPISKFHVSSTTSGDAVFTLDADTDNSNESDNARIEMFQDGGSVGAYIGFNKDWGITSGAADNLFRIGMRYSNIDNYNHLVINGQNGNVGIGTDLPQYRLDVAGHIRATEIKVEADWWDEVFEDNYRLMPLDQLEAYIDEHGHLPDIPSEEEVNKQGVSLGNTSALLLKKIEELTLHIIEQQKQIDTLEKSILNKN